jgi:low affinity Fe/Cu permease
MNIYIVAGIIIIAVGTFVMIYGQLKKSVKINPFIIISVGILLIAFGTIVMIYGQYEKSKEDSSVLQSKVDDVLKRIDEAKKGEINESSGGKIQKIEQEFQIWAAEFLKDRERKKIKLTKRQLDSVDVQLKVSNELRPVFEYVLKTIDSLARAYKAESSKIVQVDFPSIPSNLYSEAASKYSGKVVFPNKTVWRVTFLSMKPPRERHPPSMYITFHQDEGRRASTDSYVCIRRSDFSFGKGFDVVINGQSVPTDDDIEGTFSFDSYRDSLKTIIRRLFEAELLRE